MNTSKKLRVDLVHHTGSMIRFITSQLPYLPISDKYITVRLPDGTKLLCKFHLHPDNPYIAGRKLIKWIKSWIPFGQKDRAIVYESPKGNFNIALPTKKRISQVDNSALIELRRRLLQASKTSPRKRRERYEIIVRERINSNLVKKLFGEKCQVENCSFTATISPHLLPFISEVHHLEHLSKGGANSPYNLAVLCANHHSIFHRDSSATIVKKKKDDVCISYDNGRRKEWIRRDLSVLHIG